MANICSNTLRVESEDKLSLAVLAKLISGWQNGDFLLFGEKCPWHMANIIGYSGIDTFIKSKGVFKKFSMRGSMGDASYIDGKLIIYFETPWNPDFRIFEAIFKKYLKDGYTVYYASDEPGCDIFLTNDPVYKNKYYLDIYTDDLQDCYSADDDLYCADRQTVIRVFKNILSTKGISIPHIYTETSLYELIENNNITIGFHKWEFEPYSTYI